MLRSVPRVLRRLRPALAHFQHALPIRTPCPAVVTIHDLSFERDRSGMGAVDRAVFRRVVPRAVRKAARVLAVSERTRNDLVELYGVDTERIDVVPHGVDPIFSPGGAPSSDSYLLFVGAVQRRKNPLAAAEAAEQSGLRLVVAGPPRDARLARELERRGADVRGYVPRTELVELYRGAACLLMPSTYEGFGLPVVEAMACGTPVVAAPDPALLEIAGDAAIFAEPSGLVPAIERAIAQRDVLSKRGLVRARRYSWEESTRRTLDAYRRVLGLA
jgi:glycosyltransferase involved in cell wall biosynthesis